ncbi:MAG: Dabb family protein [Rhizobium sp.]|nr:Dabb family protein [Rhizobium sp.]
MIRHIVFFTVPERDNLEAVIEGLSLLTGIPHARRLEIGTNIRADRFDGRIDVAVHGEFDDEAALAAYHAHPLYQQSIDRVRPLRGERYAVDYVIEDAVAEDLTLSPTKSAV